MRLWRRHVPGCHPIVHVLLGGTVFTSFTAAMSVPFLAIYLRNAAGLDAATIGLVVGAGPLAGTLSGFVGGLLSDIIGRTRLITLGLVAMAAGLVGFVATAHPAALLVFSVLHGVGRSFVQTVSKALMGDLTPEERRFRVFANRYLAMNIGFAAGPAAGALLGASGHGRSFLIAALAALLYAGVLGLMFRRHEVRDGSAASERVTVADAWSVMRTDAVLLFLIVGGVLLTTVHGQMSVTLSQYLNGAIADGARIFGLLMSVNGVTVLLLQVPLARWSERFSLFNRLAIGSLLLAAGEIGFAGSQGWFEWVVSMFVFTCGEILVVPAEFAQMDRITPAGMRGTYYGAQSFSELGNFCGPWLGGIVLDHWGGPVMFLFMGALSLASLAFFARASRMYERKHQAVA